MMMRLEAYARWAGATGGEAMDLILDTHPGGIQIGQTGVRAELEVYRLDDGTHQVIINGWSSAHVGRGNTNCALKIIRKDWPGKIVANGVGLDDPNCPSFAYWAHQLQNRRIDIAFDDEGRRVWVDDAS